MKITFLSVTFLCCLIFQQCILLDTIGLTLPERSVTGREAKDTITTKAVLGGLAGGVSADIVFTLLAPTFAKVKDSAYYNKTDVDKCAEDAMLINVVTVNIGGFNCNLREHKLLIDWPVPIL
jgi:small lipoprotein (TIGR04452 family)